MRTVVQGTKGTIILDNSSPSIILNKEHISDDPCFEGVNQQATNIHIGCAINSHNFAAEATDFCKSLLEGTPVVADAISGMSTAAICIGIVESFKTGEKVKIDYNV